ncbi:hypothetical protein [Maridesulfovibrio sp.]|uniref:hypothetical protein n=1 Tax=Maridesulfovibrio sp. TaxID=2795000 RepID=UPI002A18C23D|nr:hypothetical protein [Maridesulfovibrio sp.]
MNTSVLVFIVQVLRKMASYIEAKFAYELQGAQVGSSSELNDDGVNSDQVVFLREKLQCPLHLDIVHIDECRGCRFSDCCYEFIDIQVAQ